MTKTIAFQGSLGANSDLACRAVFPSDKTLPCLTFEDAFAAVRDNKADLAMIAVENTIAGRVADVHHLLPEGGLHIIGEHYQPIHHHLLGLPNAKLSDIKTVHSHIHALNQCRQWLRAHNITPLVHADTAGAAADIAQQTDPSVAALATELAGTIYGLKSLATDIADQKNNVTRFLILSKQAEQPPTNIPCITSLLFRVRSIPASLYKALGGFATNAVNITKLESYLVDGKFTAAQFYLEAESHTKEPALKQALEELAFFAHEVKILGVYPAHKFRQQP